MSQVGQIIYNLQNYNVGGRSSTSGIDIYTDLVPQLIGAGNSFVKLSIQAPPGTKFEVNGNKILMIGRTGIYEMDEDITINALKFYKKEKYELDEVATAEALANGEAAMTAAETKKTQALADAGLVLSQASSWTSAQWTTYDGIQQTFISEYTIGYLDYIKGVNGIYKEDTSGEGIDLIDIIVDYIY